MAEFTPEFQRGNAMLTADDTPTIRFAIMRRLDQEPGVEICDLKFAKHPDHIAVGGGAKL